MGRDAVELAVAEEEPGAVDRESLSALASEQRQATVGECMRHEMDRAAGNDPASLTLVASPASAGLDSLAAVGA